MVALLPFALLSTLAVQAQEINLRNANFYLSQDDIAVQKPGAPLQLSRAYNSRSNEKGVFGYGWSTPFDTLVEIHADGSLLVFDADGFVLRYTLNGRPWDEVSAEFVDRLIAARKDDDKAHGQLRDDATYQKLRDTWIKNANEREQASYALNRAWVDPADGTYLTSDRGSETLVKKGSQFIRTRADGLVETFDKDGKLLSRLDTAGHGLRFDYDRDRRLSKMAHTDGAGFTLVYGAGGRVQEVRDTEGRVITYQYDEEGNLLQVNGPGKRTSKFTYDDAHNLTALRQPDGTGISIQYDVAKDWAIAMKKGDQVTRYEWQLVDDLASRYTCNVTAPDGTRTRYDYNDAEHKMEVTDAQGRVTRTLYSTCCDKPVETTSADGKVTRYEYDKKGRLVGVTRPDGVTARYQYDPDFNRILQASFTDGRRYTYSYDAGGRVIKAESSNGRVLSFKYGANGKVSEVAGADGKKYTFEYDADGRPTRITGQKNISLEMSYGPAGNLVGSQISSPSTSAKQSFYRDLQEVLDMLEPATGAF